MTNKLEQGLATERLELRVPMTLKKKIQAEAIKSGLSVSEYVRITMQQKMRNSA